MTLESKRYRYNVRHLRHMRHVISCSVNVVSSTLDVVGLLAVKVGEVATIPLSDWKVLAVYLYAAKLEATPTMPA